MSRRGFSMLQSEAEKQRKIGDGTLLQFAFVQIEEMREIATGRSGAGEGAWVDILQTKFGERFGEGASEAGCLSDRGEIRQLVGSCGGVNNAGGQRLHTKAGDGRQRETAHGLGGEMGGKLRECERVNALAAGWKSAGGQFIRGYAGGGDNQDFRVPGLICEKCGSAVEERSVGAGVK